MCGNILWIGHDDFCNRYAKDITHRWIYMVLLLCAITNQYIMQLPYISSLHMEAKDKLMFLNSYTTGLSQRLIIRLVEYQGFYLKKLSTGFTSWRLIVKFSVGKIRQSTRFGTPKNCFKTNFSAGVLCKHITNDVCVCVCLCVCESVARALRPYFCISWAN